MTIRNRVVRLERTVTARHVELCATVRAMLDGALPPERVPDDVFDELLTEEFPAELADYHGGPGLQQDIHDVKAASDEELLVLVRGGRTP